MIWSNIEHQDWIFGGGGLVEQERSSMDYNSRKAGIGSTQSSKDLPRSMMAEDPSKSGRVAATALGRPTGKEHHGGHGVKRSLHDHMKSSSSTTKSKEPPQRISRDYTKSKDHDTGTRKPVTTPQLLSKTNRNMDSLGRAQAEKVPHRVVKDDRERDNLKRAKGFTGGEDTKMVQRVKDKERDNLLNQRSQAGRDREDFKVVQRPKGDREILNQGVRVQATSADDSKGTRLERPRDSLKPKIATRPVVAMKPHNERTLKTDMVTNPSTRVEVDIVKKAKLASDRKRTMGVTVKAEDAKDHVREQRSVTRIEPVIASKNGRETVAKGEPVRSVKMVTGTAVMKAKQEKLKKKVFSLPGQRFEPPEERDALRLFYGSLHRQIPTSDMANIWLMEHGLLEADEAQKVLTQRVKSKTGLVSKAPTPSKFSNGSAGKSSKFKNEDFLDIKPVSKKLKL